MTYPQRVENEAMLDELLSIPDQTLIDFMKRIDGDIAILGIGGKMGPTLGRLAVNAIRAGDDIKTIQGNLGHASAAFTLDRYGHFTERMKQDSAARMEGFIKAVFSS